MVLSSWLCHCESSSGLFDECRLSAEWPPTLRPNQLIWAMSPPKDWLLPSAYTIAIYYYHSARKLTVMKSVRRYLRYLCVFVAVCLFFALTCYIWECTHTCAFIMSQVQQTCDLMTAPVMLGQIDPNRKYAVCSTTSAANAESLGFIFLLPLTALAWKRIGFDSVVIIVGYSVDVWHSDALLYTVLASIRQLDATVIFINVQPTNSVMLSQVLLHNHLLT